MHLKPKLHLKLRLKNIYLKINTILEEIDVELKLKFKNPVLSINLDDSVLQHIYIYIANKRESP